jgi:hypothetical protein
MIQPHQLHHSCATLLLNAGAPVLAVQTILGHKFIDTTLGYARLYDGTIAADYYRAVAQIESRFQDGESTPAPPDSGQLLALVDALQAGSSTRLKGKRSMLCGPASSPRSRRSMRLRPRMATDPEPRRFDTGRISGHAEPTQAKAGESSRFRRLLSLVFCSSRLGNCESRLTRLGCPVLSKSWLLSQKVQVALV